MKEQNRGISEGMMHVHRQSNEQLIAMEYKYRRGHWNLVHLRGQEPMSMLLISTAVYEIPQ